MRFECKAEDLILVKKIIELCDSETEKRFRRPDFCFTWMGYPSMILRFEIKDIQIGIKARWIENDLNRDDYENSDGASKNIFSNLSDSEKGTIVFDNRKPPFFFSVIN